MPLQSGNGQGTSSGGSGSGSGPSGAQNRERRRRHHHHHHHHSQSRNTGTGTSTALNNPEDSNNGLELASGSSEAVVRYSTNGQVEMNGYRRGKSQSPDVTSWVQASSSMRNGAAANGQVWRLGKVFNENDEALINRKLPKELLLRIFSHLDVVSLCRCAQVRPP